MEPPRRPNPPATDKRLAKVTIGEPRRVDGPIRLVESDPSWPDLYVREAKRIRAVLGDRIRVLEHVGSTSVNGLVAKPIIDVLLAVPDSADEASYLPQLESAGYVLRIREPDWHEHRLLKGPDTDINLHVFSEGSPEIDRMITFRDHLRAAPDDLQLYADTKRALASRRWKYVQNYADAKTSVVENILLRATTTSG
jgi:GrpB-like predicted nucleotidyltransferase (UPF0157 family)